MRKSNFGFTYSELLLMMLFLSIFAFMAIPKMNFGVQTQRKAKQFSSRMVTELRRTRSLALAEASRNSSGFALNMTGGVPYSGYEIENLDSSATVESLTIDESINCSGGNNFSFGPSGGLVGGSDTQLTISGSGKTFTISITASTGMIECVES